MNTPPPPGRGFRATLRATIARAPDSWNSLTTGLGAMASLFLVHGWLLSSQHNPPSVVGVILLPLGAVLTLHGWAYGRGLVMLAGVGVAFVGAAGPFWIMNLT